MIYCDLDGVFADFAGAACRIHGRPDYKPDRWNFFTEWDMDAETFWAPIRKSRERFYDDLVLPHVWAGNLLYALEHANDDWAIVTANADPTPVSYSSKKAWIDKYLQPLVDHDIELIICNNKWRLANYECLLIDDCDKNLGLFSQCGGHILRFPQPWNLAWYEGNHGPPDRLDYTLKILQEWSTFRHVK